MGIPGGFLCSSITIQKSLAIKNQKLGLLFRILQLGALTVVLLQIILAKAWNTETTPVSYGFEMWTADADEISMDNAEVKHCKDVPALAYNYGSTVAADNIYAPTYCELLSAGQDFSKSGMQVFFPTHIRDVYVSSSPTTNKCAGFACPAGQKKKVYSDRCECEQMEIFFVKNPELRKLVINHGFNVEEVDMMGGKIDNKARSTQKLADDKAILTVITMKGDNEKKCNVGGKIVWDTKTSSWSTTGGKSSWTVTAASGGISGSLKEWMACGGVDLDGFADQSKSNLPGETDAPRVRIVGASVEINLHYTNDHLESDHDGPVCYIHVNVLPLWNSQTATAFTRVPTPQDKTSSYRFRMQYGLSVTLKATGTFYWFDFNALLMVFTTAIVLLKLPGTIVQFVATTFVGRLSKIYKAVAVEEFNVVDRFHGLAARLLGHKMSFAALTGSEKAGITPDLLDSSLQCVMVKEKEAGVLSTEEISHMATFLMEQMDEASSGSVSQDEFLKASNNNEAIKMSDLATFFDKEAKVSILEKIFGDVAGGISEGSAKKVKPTGVGTSDP